MQKSIIGKALSLLLALVLALGMGVTAFASGSAHSLAAPSDITDSGLTASITFDGGNTATSGTTVTANVTLTGTAEAAGDYSVTVATAGSTIDFETVELEGTVAKNGEVDASGSFTFEMPAENVTAAMFAFTFDFTADDPDPNPDPDPDDELEPDDKTPPKTTNPSTSSSGGGSGSSGSSVSTAPARSANVSADGSVNATTITNELKQALKTAGTGTATVSIKNAESISAAAIKSLAQAAAATGKAAVVHADTIGADGKIQGRLYIDPAKLTGMTGSLKLGVATQGARPTSRQSLFERHFNNKVAVVSCAQQGSFGTKLKLAAKVQLPGDGKALVFYSYDTKTNTFKRINTSYRIDKNGYIHFETELAGDIIISDKPLARK